MFPFFLQIIRTGEGTRPESRNICEIKYECKYNDKTIEKIDFLKVPVSDSEVSFILRSHHYSVISYM